MSTIPSHPRPKPELTCTTLHDAITQLMAYWKTPGRQYIESEWAKALSSQAKTSVFDWHGPANTCFPSAIPVLRTWFAVAKKLFFNDMIHDEQCALHFYAKHTEEWKEDRKSEDGCTYGITRYTRHEGEVMTRIYIYERHDDAETREEQMHQYFSTLLHEMMHAFFDIHQCACIECSESEHVEKIMMGVTGHGPFWLPLANLLRQLASRCCGFGDLDLGVLDGLRTEIVARNLVEGEELDMLKEAAGVVGRLRSRDPRSEILVEEFHKWMKKREYEIGFY